MAQRSISAHDIELACEFGQVYYRHGAKLYVLRQRDIPAAHRRHANRLNGIVVCVGLQDQTLLTVFRNPNAIKQIRKKSKWRCNYRHLEKDMWDEHELDGVAAQVFF